MRINADFTQRAVIRPKDYDWVPSPAAGVERMMLDRIGEEVARATSLVRFAPNSEFDAHTHGGGEEYLVRWQPGTRFKRHSHWGGEEILVLEGTFSDEHGDYPKGSWLRNPHLSEHTPYSEEGCLIYVKTGHLPAR